MLLKIMQAMNLGLVMSGFFTGVAVAQSTCPPEGLYLEEWLPHIQGDGTEVPGEQKLVAYWEYRGTVSIGDTPTTCLGGNLSAHLILDVDSTGWKRSTPSEPVIAAINALKLPIDLSGTIGADGRGMVELTRYWFWWNGDELQKHETYTQPIRLTRIETRLLLLQEDMEPVEMMPGGAPIELPSDGRFAFEVQTLNLETVPSDSGIWVDLTWVPGIPLAEATDGIYTARSFKATKSGQTSLRTGWLTPKLVTEVLPEEWGAEGVVRIQAGQTIKVGVGSSWGDGKQALVFTQKMPEPKELYFVRVAHDTETRVDPTTVSPGDNLRVVAVYDADVAQETGSVLLRSDAESLGVSVTRAVDNPRVFKSAVIRIQEAPVKAEVKAEAPVTPEAAPESPTTSPATNSGGDITVQ